MKPKEALAILWEKDKVEAWEFIRTLVAKAEPMNPIKYLYGGFQCPTCKGLSVQTYNGDLSERNLNFCDDCGQALDWSDEKGESK